MLNGYNILNNAKDAIKDNGIENGLIRAQLQQKKKHIEITICDNGGGIDASILEKLGEPYVTTKSKNGTGLGIYMSNIIVTKQLSGTLAWKNKDKGCCFAISLPL